MRLYQSLLGRPPPSGPTFLCPPLIVAVGVIRDLEVVGGAPTPIGHVIVDPCGSQADSAGAVDVDRDDLGLLVGKAREDQPASIRRPPGPTVERLRRRDRKSTRLNSSHRTISYAVFCLKKKKKK